MWIIIHVFRWLMRRVVQSENYSYCVECMMNYSQSEVVVFDMLLYDRLESEWGSICCCITIITLWYSMHHMLSCYERGMFASSKCGLVTCPKLIVGAWSSKWVLRFHILWNSVRTKNQLLSRYCMHIKLSYEPDSEWRPWRAWVKSIVALHYIMIVQLICLYTDE